MTWASTPTRRHSRWACATLCSPSTRYTSRRAAAPSRGSPPFSHAHHRRSGHIAATYQTHIWRAKYGLATVLVRRHYVPTSPLGATGSTEAYNVTGGPAPESMRCGANRRTTSFGSSSTKRRHIPPVYARSANRSPYCPQMVQRTRYSLRNR